MFFFLEFTVHFRFVWNMSLCDKKYIRKQQRCLKILYKDFPDINSSDDSQFKVSIFDLV